jgi:DNA-binding NarL/FixJ family response regulator
LAVSMDIGMNDLPAGFRNRSHVSGTAVTRLKIVLVDEHALFRVGVRQFLLGVPGYDVIGEASCAREAFKLIDATSPDLVLMGIAMPGMDGIIATREIRRRAPDVRVLIFSAFDEVSEVMDALDAGAGGYVLKSDDTDVLLEALQQVGRGQRFLAPRVATLVADAAAAGRGSTEGLGVLSEREREVFRLAADGRPNSEIARDLCLARKTVDTHLNRINRKLQLRNRAELVRFAIRLGLVHAIRLPLRGR